MTACLFAVMLLLMAGVTGLANIGAATPYNDSIVVNDVFARNETEAYQPALDDSADEANVTAELDWVNVTWDSTRLYFSIGNDDGFDLSASDVMICVDTKAGGGDVAPWAKGVLFTGSRLPDYVVGIELAGTEFLETWSGTAWTQSLGTIDSALDGAGNTHLEVAVDLADLGTPTTINYTVFLAMDSGSGVADYNNGSAYMTVDVLDSTVDANYTSVSSSTDSGGNGADLDELHVTWNGTHLFVALTTFNSANWDVAYVISFDTKAGGYATGLSDVWGRKVDFSGWAPDYQVAFWWEDGSGDITSSQWGEWTGSWTTSDFFAGEGTEWSNSGDGTVGLQTLELRIPWSYFGGTPAEVKLNAYVCGDTGTSAVDSIPADLQTDTLVNGADEWGDEDTFYTFATIFTDRALVPDVAPDNAGGLRADGTRVVDTDADLAALNGLDTPDVKDWFMEVDGNVTVDGWSLDERMETHDAGSPGDPTDDATFYVSWNATHLFFGLQNVDQKEGVDGHDWIIALDTDPGTSNGTGAEFYGPYFNASNTNLPEYCIRYWKDGAGETVSLHTGNGSDWNAFEDKAWANYMGWSGNRNSMLAVPMSELAGVGIGQDLGVMSYVSDGATDEVWLSFPTTNPTGAKFSLNMTWAYVMTGLTDGAAPSLLGGPAADIVTTEPVWEFPGTNRTIVVGESVNIYGNGSTDDVGIANYTWRTFNGTMVQQGSDLYVDQFGWSAGSADNYTIQLTVRDAMGQEDTRSVWINVTPDAVPPAASFNTTTDADAVPAKNRTIVVGEKVYFDGTDSYDDVGIINYTWNLTDGGPVFKYDQAWNYTFNNVGNFTVWLNVSDAGGNWDRVSVWINVTGDVTPPVARANTTLPPDNTPGTDRTIIQGTLVELNGTGSYDDGTITEYTWTVTLGGSLEAGFSAAVAQYTFGVPGYYFANLTVKDGGGNQDTDSVWLDVQADVTDPVSDAGPGQTVPQGTLVSFDGSGSTDDGVIKNYTWTFDDSGPVVLYGVAASHTFNDIGNYTITLNATDYGGNWNASATWVNVTDGIAPEAAAASDAGINVSVVQGTTVTFDGSASTDNVGITNYTWTFNDTVARTLWGAGPAYAFLNPENVTITLNVTDAEGYWDTDSFWLDVTNDTVKPVSMIATTTDADAMPSGNRTIGEGEAVHFNGSGSADDGLITNYTWSVNGTGNVSFDTAWSHAFASQGNYTVTLNVTDLGGNWNYTHVWVNVTTPLFAPVCTVNTTLPPSAVVGTNRTVIQGTLVGFQGSAYDVDGTVDNYTWTIDLGGTVAETFWTPAFQHRFLTSGNHTVNLTARDDDGLTNISSVWIMVDADTQNPVPGAEGNWTIDQGDTIIFNASGTTDNGVVESYQWSFFDGSMVNLAGLTPSHTFLTPGNYTVTLNVTDYAGNSGETSIWVKVNDTQLPTAIAGPDQDVIIGTVVELDGTASWDNVGIVSHEWSIAGAEQFGFPMSGAVVTELFDVPGEYLLTLTVEDAEGNVGTDEVRVNVSLGTDRPSVVWAAPNATSADVGLDADVVVRFDGYMNASSVEAAFAISDGATTWTAADGNVSWEGPLLSFVFTPSFGLEYGTAYTCSLDCLSAKDVAGNNYLVSNAANYVYTWSFTTRVAPVADNEPVLSNASLSPAGGDATTNFTFSVRYDDADGDAPLYVRVFIDGVPYPMVLRAGENASDGIYEYSTTLAPGNHTYYFTAYNGVNNETAFHADAHDAEWAMVVDPLESLGDDVDDAGANWTTIGIALAAMAALALIIVLAMSRMKGGKPPGEPGDGDDEALESGEAEEAPEGEPEPEGDDAGPDDEETSPGE